MDRLSDIKAAYDLFFQHIEDQTKTFSQQNNLPAIERLEKHRDILERGVFVLMFSQFEKSVTEKFNVERDRRTSNLDWSHRRGWDVPSLSGRKVPFDTKLALVLDRKTQEYSSILEAYATRNHCAHGGTSNSVGSIDSLEAKIHQWHSQLVS